MKNIQKSGITIVTLVITVIILTVLTGAVMLTTNNSDIFGQTQNTVDDYNKQAMIEQIQMKIQKERLAKINRGETGFTIKEDVIPVVKSFGTYEEDTLKLTTTTSQIEIYLYEILDIKIEEYITAVYKDKVFTLTEKEESLSSNGYKYEYTYDNGVVWQTYTNPTTIQEQSGIKVRIVNSEGQVISNEYVVTKGVGEETINKIKAITITNPPTKTTYKQGETFSASGMQITVTYEDNTTKVVTNYNYTPTRTLTVSDRYVTISYTENGVTKQTTQNITVTNNLTGIAILTEPTRTEYRQGESFDKTGMVVRALYEDSTSNQITNYTVTPTVLTASDTSVTITYQEGNITETTTQDIKVAYLETIEITKEPTKTVYAIGENFDKAGMIVTAIYKYSDGTTYGLPVTNYTVVGGNNLQLGTANVTITYTEGGITKEITQTIRVKEAIAPTIALTTNSNTTPSKAQSTTIEITEEYDVTYSYGWSTSKEIAPSEWISSTNKSQEVTIDGKDGNYYLWVKDLEDSYENKGTTQTVAGIEVNLISEAFILDNTKPTIALTVDSNATPSKAQSTTIQITETNNVTYKYGWTNSNSVAPTQWTEGTSKNVAVTQNAGDGNYYLWVKDLQDVAGNVAQTTTVNANTVNKVSGAFVLDNTGPSIEVVIGEESNVYTISVNITEANEVDLSKSGYVLSETGTTLGTGIGSYTDGNFTSTTEELIVGVCGNHYYHVLATDTAGNTSTYISTVIEGTNTEYGIIENETTYSYMNSIQEVQLTPGLYQLEVWGAAGGDYGGGLVAGTGGYSSGLYNVENTQTLFIVTGGQGGTSNGSTGGAGGYNGGGSGGKHGGNYSGGGSGGGGATHIATVSGLLSSLSNSRTSILLVAGGGGGPTAHSSGGAGGGLNGGSAISYAGTVINGGTQDSGYAFGLGQNGVSKPYNGDFGVAGNGGGGGGFYGGYASQQTGYGSDAGGAGGSGYISSVLKNATTVAGEGSTTNGYAKITKIQPSYQYLDSIPIDDSKLYLYANGDQCTDVTGGWSAFTVPGQYPSASTTNASMTHTTPIFNANNIYLNGTCKISYGGTSSCIRTNNMIDLSNYEKIIVNAELISGTNYLQFGLRNNLNIPYGELRWNEDMTTFALAPNGSSYELDISALSGECYFFIQAYGWQWGSSQGPAWAEFYVYEVWLE